MFVKPNTLGKTSNNKETKYSLPKYTFEDYRPDLPDLSDRKVLQIYVNAQKIIFDGGRRIDMVPRQFLSLVCGMVFEDGENSFSSQEYMLDWLWQFAQDTTIRKCDFEGREDIYLELTPVDISLKGMRLEAYLDNCHNGNTKFN